MGASTRGDTKGKGAQALDSVKTERKTGAAAQRKAADAAAARAAKPDAGGAKPSGDSPKRQGDKLDKAARAAAGKAGSE
jgi:hypothetical protein